MEGEPDCGSFEDMPKTEASDREIILIKDIISIIEHEKLQYGKKIIPIYGYIFHLPDGTPLSRECV